LHPVKDCKDTSDELKELLRKHYDEKKKTKFARLHEISIGNGRWQATIENQLQFVALGDIGADQSTVLKSVIFTLVKDGHVLNTSPIIPPVELEGAVTHPGADNATTSSKVELFIYFLLSAYYWLREHLLMVILGSMLGRYYFLFYPEQIDNSTQLEKYLW